MSLETSEANDIVKKYIMRKKDEGMGIWNFPVRLPVNLHPSVL